MKILAQKDFERTVRDIGSDINNLLKVYRGKDPRINAFIDTILHQVDCYGKSYIYQVQQAEILGVYKTCDCCTDAYGQQQCKQITEPAPDLEPEFLAVVNPTNDQRIGLVNMKIPYIARCGARISPAVERGDSCGWKYTRRTSAADDWTDC